jgi:hypothetical protein
MGEVLQDVNWKKQLHGGDKHDESKKHNFEKKVVTTCNWCYKHGQLMGKELCDAIWKSIQNSSPTNQHGGRW